MPCSHVREQGHAQRAAGTHHWGERLAREGSRRQGWGPVSAQDAVVTPRCRECKRIRVCGDAQKARGGEGGPGHPESACATADAGDLRQGPQDPKGLEDRKPPPGPHHRKKGLR